MLWFSDDMGTVLRKTLGEVNGYFFIAVENTRVRFMSAELYPRLGYQRNRKAPLAILDVMRRQDWKEIEDEAPPPLFESRPRIVSMLRSDGTVLPAKCLVSKYQQDSSTLVVYIVGTFSDLSYSISDDSSPAVDPGQKSQQDTLAFLSHEIRTPIAALNGLISLLDPSELNEEQAKIMRAIEPLSRSIQTLLSDVLDSSKIWAGQMVLAERPFRLLDACRDIIDRYALISPKLIFTLNYAPSIPELIVADGGRIEQVLNNLISNAVKYTEKGYITIDVEPDPPGEYLTISVTDTGEGIPEQLRPTVFNAYIRNEQKGSKQSTGLGLYISKKIVELHGGSIALESEEGIGTTISFTLPIRTPDEQELPSGTIGLSHLPQVAPRPTRRGANQHILLVDDNKINLLVVGKFLKRWGYEYTEATSGQEALHALARQPFGLVLLDIRMPGMDGFEAARRIRQLTPPSDQTPIMALTASTEPGVVENIFEADMDGYIFKPFKSEELKERIEQLIGPAGQTKA
ncbi:MAG: hypothetical protein CSA07_03255 [Bacteroidia bacterium]|nr:MAG: hypothetical protein CSA07_03255 [Bacteroidia bacterium]